MPVNVSKPDWACEVCGTRFREDHAAAARCEAAPVPDLLPEGTPLLSVAQGRLTLVPLAHTGHIGTRATSYTDTTGHFHHYRRGDVPVEGDMLMPGTAGHVQHLGGRSLTLYGVRSDDRPAQVSVEALREAAGLVTNGEGDVSSVSTMSPSRAAPITGPVRAVLDMLGARLVRSRNVYHQRGLVQAWLVEQQGGCQRVARGLTHLVDHAQVLSLIYSEQERWLAGEPGVSAFRPTLRSTSRLSPSKLTKAQRAAVEATGVPWQPRTGADDYVRTLITEALMERSVETTDRAWGRSAAVAVGGGKGGVGKSTVAAALARAVARTGRSVTLLDLDLESPSQHLINDLGSEVPLTDDGKRIAGVEVEPGLRVLSPAQFPGLPRQWSESSAAVWMRFVTEHVAFGDVVVLDMPPGVGPLGPHVYGKHGRDRVDLRVLVTTADPLSLEAAQTSLASADHHGQVPAVVVENASAVSDGTHTIRLHGADGDVERFAAAQGLGFAGSLPWVTDLDALAGGAAMSAVLESVRPTLGSAEGVR